MVQIAGKYVIKDANQFVEHLKKEGVPEERIKQMSEGEHFLEIKLDGKKLWINDHHGNRDSISDLVLGEEKEEKKSWGNFKVLATLDGNVLTQKMQGEKGELFTKISTFSDEGVEVVLPSYKGGASGKLIYKRE
ncbi:uncharacterized protein [Leptinotarsa decemlineata]|uniref:uncharacterized protein n=1 Tax=Leptinotarsa decemlineata TaxID=7539 RepID=UPI003D308293